MVKFNFPNRVFVSKEKDYNTLLEVAEKHSDYKWLMGEKPTEYHSWSTNGIVLNFDSCITQVSGSIGRTRMDAVDFEDLIPKCIGCKDETEVRELFSILKTFKYNFPGKDPGEDIPIFPTFKYPIVIYTKDNYIDGWDKECHAHCTITPFEVFQGGHTMESEEVDLGPVGTQLFQQQYPTNALTDEECDYLKTEMMILLSTYEYDYEEEYLEDIIEEWNNQKGWLINLLKKSPYYVEGKFLIKMPVEYRLGIDMKKVYDVAEWFNIQLRNWINNNEIRTYFFTYTELCNILDKLETKYDLLNKCRINGINANYHGMSLAEVEREYERYERIKDKLFHDSIITGNFKIRVSADKMGIIEEGRILIDALDNIKDYIDKEGKISENGEHLLNDSTFPHSKGMKFMRYFSKVCESFGFDKTEEIRDISFTDQNGNYKEKKKDFGYKFQRASLGDAISQPKVKDELYISVNPIDWLTMSFLNKVASCHTIDKANMRGCTSTYSGEYSSGTISYMLDSVSFMAYELYKGTDYEEYKGELSDDITRKTKQRRAVYVLDDNKLFMSILYPDGRDGGDKDRATYWNDYVKEHIASLLDVDNDWSTVRDIFYEDQIRQVSGSTLYNDFRNSGHGVQCFKNELRIAYKPEKTVLKFGAKPICIKCGERHTYNRAIECGSCWDDDHYAYHCERCGDGISEDDYDAIWVGDTVYCCDECAHNDGAEYCSDIENWSFNHWYSELEGCFYSEDKQNYTVYKDGYEYDVSWDYFEDNCIHDDYADEDVVESCTDWFKTPEGDIFTTEFYSDYVELPDGYAPNEDYAREWGYAQNEAGDWVPEDELEDNNNESEVVA